MTAEDSEQITFFGWLAIAQWRGAALTDFAFHIPNGGSRYIAEAVKLQKMGVKPGVSDVFLGVAVSCFHGLFIEMKARGGGRESAEQKAFRSRMTAQGYDCRVCHGADEAIAQVTRYIGLTGFPIVIGFKPRSPVPAWLKPRGKA